MLRHYVLQALRNLRRTPAAAALNVLTLALGVACFVITYAFVAFWEGADRHFANADRIAVMTTSMRFAGSGFAIDGAVRTPDHFAQYIEADIPQIERTARATSISPKTTVSSGGRAVRGAAVAVDAAFLELFELPFAAGDARTALAVPRSVVVTKPFAAQLFGDSDPLGQRVRLEDLVETTVTGVIEAIPEPSHMGRSWTAELTFDLLASRDVLETIRERTAPPNAPPPRENWFEASAMTYVLLPRDGSFAIESLRAALPGFTQRHVPQEARTVATLEYGAIPVREVLRRGVDDELFFTDLGMSISSALLLLGGLVLGVACVNYANLAVARAATRLREVGVRKALGARPVEIVLQHLTEAALSTAMAAVLAFGVFLAAAPLLASLMGADLGATQLGNPRFWLALVVVLAAVTLVSGLYPALALSRIEPAHAVRASRASIGPRRLSAWLVGSQFTVASFLLIAVALSAQQNAALRRTGSSTATAPLVVVDSTSRAARIDHETFRTELTRFPEIEGVTTIGNLPWASLSTTGVRSAPEASAPMHTVMTHGVGFDFFSTFDVELLAGRVFARDYGDDAPAGAFSAAEQPIVVDRTFAEDFGFASPEAAVGGLVYLPTTGETATPLRIVGVVEDKIMIFFNIGMQGTMYQLRGELPYHVVKIARDDVAGALARIDAIWQKLAPNTAIERMFLDEVFGRVYESYRRIAQLFGALASIAFLICLTGLFGTASLVASRRIGEIGVRKTLGASTWGIVAMLLAAFSKPVIVANVLAWPLAFIAARAYLDTFRNPIEVTVWPFALSLLITCGIAWLTVGTQTLRAARARPADVLRHDE